MNPTIEQLLQHRSIRKFTDEPVSDELLHTIVAAAQMASTSSHVQAYSIIHITDANKKRTLASLAGNQRYVEECPVFLVWCADLERLRHAYARHDDPNQGHFDTTENMIVATVDTALAAQNAAVAAESAGLGICYIGGIRNRIEDVSRLLELPEYVYPLFGMSIGYPAQDPEVKPRLPLEAVLHENVYQSDSYTEQLERYDQTISDYMERRTRGKMIRSWTENIHGKFASPARSEIRDYLQKQGWMRR